MIGHQVDVLKNSNYRYVILALKGLTCDRQLHNSDKEKFAKFLNMIISSQALYEEKVQRLSHDWEYRAIAIGSGSARAPEDKVYDIVCSMEKSIAGVISA